MLADALRVAGGLRARGLMPGDRVALVVPEVGGFVRSFFGISAAGLVPVPMCPPAHAGDLPTFARQSRHILVASRAAAVVTSADVAPLITDRDRATLLIDALPGPPLEAPIDVQPEAP